MKPSLDDMQVFVEVVETRSFTGAADRLNLTKSAISQTITRLENDLGARLLHRSTRALSLTEAGARFLTHCKNIKVTYNTAISDMKADATEPTGTLSITASKALCGHVAAPAIKRFIELYPGIRVRLLADDAPTDLVQSQIDLALRVGEPNIQAAKISKLGSLVDGLYASPDYIARQGGSPNDLAMIADWDLISNVWDGVPIEFNMVDNAPLRVVPRIRCNSFHDIKHMVERGAGVARLPDIAVDESVAMGRLVKLFEVGSSPFFSMHLFAKSPPIKVKKFLLLLRSEIKAKKIPQMGRVAQMQISL